MRVVVTGATGFIGRHLMARLVQSGIDAVGLSRLPASGAADARSDSWEIQIFDAGRLSRVLASADVVIHLAGRAHVLRETADDPEQEFRVHNVELTRMLVEASVMAGVRRFVFLSSIGAVCESSVSPVTEETTPHPQTAYGRTKLDAERLVLSASRRGAIEGVVLRPSLVYGPGMKGNPFRLFAAVQRGIPIPVSARPNRRSFLGVSNLVDAIALAAEHPLAAGQLFNVSDSPALSTEEFVVAVGKALGRSARPVRISGAVAAALGWLGDPLAAALGSPLPSIALKRLSSSLEVDATKLRQLFGDHPTVGLERGLKRSSEWFLRATRKPRPPQS